MPTVHDILFIGRKYESAYFGLERLETSEIVESTGCQKPCRYRKIRNLNHEYWFQLKINQNPGSSDEWGNRQGFSSLRKTRRGLNSGWWAGKRQQRFCKMQKVGTNVIEPASRCSSMASHLWWLILVAHLDSSWGHNTIINGHCHDIVVFTGSPSWHCGTGCMVLARLSTGSRSWSSPAGAETGWKRRQNNNKPVSVQEPQTRYNMLNCWYLGVLAFSHHMWQYLTPRYVLYCQSLIIIRRI